jgi:homoserine kinase
LDALEDMVRITRSERDGPRISIQISDNRDQVPVAVESNSAGLVVSRMLRDFQISDFLTVEIKKGVPAGYGVGSSAASAAAAAIAMKSLYNLRIPKDSLVDYAAEGEIASAGTKHYDNVSASLLGGFVVSSVARGDRTYIRLEPPRDLVVVVAIPISMKVPAKKTEVARAVLPRDVPLGSVVHNISSASTIVAGFALKDVSLIARGIDDVIVEPARKGLIPGYDEVKRRALDAGALAFTISGAGPSVIAFANSARRSRNIADSMKGGFRSAGIESKTLICRASKGAHPV